MVFGGACGGGGHEVPNTSLGTSGTPRAQAAPQSNGFAKIPRLSPATSGCSAKPVSLSPSRPAAVSLGIQECSAGLAAGAGTKGSSGSRSGNGSSRPMAFPSLPLKGSQDTPLNRRPKTLRSVTNVRNWRPPKCPALNWNRCEGALAPKWLSPKKGILGKISNHPGHN